MPPLNQTSYVILGLLSAQSNLSGYDIRQAVQSSIGYFWGESYGQIYPALKRLAGQRLIARARSASGRRKRRQEYVLTEAGRDSLRQWLALPFHNPPLRNEFLLKLFFCGEAVPGVAIAHIQDLQERNRRTLDALLKIEALVPPEQLTHPHLPYWLLTLSMGKVLTRAALEWGESALATLSARERSTAQSAQPPGTLIASKAASPRKQLRTQRSSARPPRRVAR